MTTTTATELATCARTLDQTDGFYIAACGRAVRVSESVRIPDATFSHVEQARRDISVEAYDAVECIDCREALCSHERGYTIDYAERAITCDECGAVLDAAEVGL